MMFFAHGPCSGRGFPAEKGLESAGWSLVRIRGEPGDVENLSNVEALRTLGAITWGDVP